MIATKADHGATRWSKILGLFIAGWLCSSAYHGTLIGERAKEVVPAVKAAADCEHRRAETVEKLALSPQMVAPSQLPKDCPHVAAVIPEELQKPKAP